ncbi:hypothetical protein [Klebsiella aerogenes]|uniref:Uncharacterized protein n=1 Tax=Klebsiella aerogenes TaxID=548 RepID=A0AAP9R1P4_KLEAE|nr:hypothetical protein [Klebsiella aerogenes]QMR42852.1 hypothetical protein HV331_25350 [Klebsiella aerogenes]
MNAHSITHTATFFSRDEEYELSLQNVSLLNLVDSSIIFPSEYAFSPQGCWEVVFDLASNRRNLTPFEPPEAGRVNALQVLKTVERMIFDHYNEFNAGMYVFWPDNEALESVYQRLIRKRLGEGTTLEYGLEPDRRGYVIRTPKCYKR